MIDHEWISIQEVIGLVLSERVFFLFIYIAMYGYMLREELKKGLSST